MRVAGWSDFLWGSPVERPLSLTVGVFDGLHLGHQRLIGRIAARAPTSLPTVITFTANPKRVLRPESFAGDLLSLPRKLEILEGLGVEMAILIDFSGDFSTMPGRNFLSVLLERGRPSLVAIGADFHCGKGRDTDAGGLAAFYSGQGVQVEILDPVTLSGMTVSSTRIRNAIQDGNIGTAELLLGRPFEVELGNFSDGRGAVLRFARPEGMVLPPPGTWPIRGAGIEGILRVRADRLELEGSGLGPELRRVPLASFAKA